MPNLFNQNLLRPYIQNHTIGGFAEKHKVISGWKRNLKTIHGVNEKALQAAFLQGVFGKVLGYKGITEADGAWDLNIETSTEIDATTPDGTLGFYSRDRQVTQVVIELKGPRVSLDKKQKRAGREYGTPVEQAFSYTSKYDRCSWVIVSNMIEIRLYKVGRSQDYYITFHMEDLDKEEEFKKFHLLLCKENLLREVGESPTSTLSEKTQERIQDISVEFYNLYKNTRVRLYGELAECNPGHEKALLLEKAQKFLDRIIFICFCEDLGLLPGNLLHDAIEGQKKAFNPMTWEEIKGVFKAIDRGSETHGIPAYNGGLFQYDEVLDSLVIRDDFFDVIYKISAYDFNSDLDTNILGHIFEQSISDLEGLKADIQKEDYDAQQSRRKKEGIYYTPRYITSYIVENSLGRYLEDIKGELGEGGLPDIESASTPGVKTRYLNQHLKFYQDYEERLKKVRVLDPACGSGAFLNQAFDFLLEEYRWVHEQVSGLQDKQLSIFNLSSYQRAVLQDNLYGVDLNEESVEITKLSLWLKTANKSEQLAYLDDNIKCGNSLIDDPGIAGDKAFNWREEFPEIMSGGGFDVVIGNPPYVRSGLIKQKNYYKNKYQVYNSSVDLFAYFYEISMHLLTSNGRLGFISNSFEKTASGTALRQYLVSNYVIEQYVDLKKVPIFKGTTTYPVILIIRKDKPDNKSSLEYIQDSQTLFNPTVGSQSKKNLSINQSSLEPNNWTFKSLKANNLLDKLKNNHKKLRDSYGKCYYGIKTGLNEAFITQKGLPISKHTKMVFEGRDIKKWFSPKPDKKLILFESKHTVRTYGDHISESDALKKMHEEHKELIDHLLPHEKKAKKRYDKGDFWWELRNCAYYNQFEKPKIIFPNLQKENKFSYDEKGFYICAPAVFLPTEDKGLLAVLNSKLIWFFLQDICILRSGGYIEVHPQYFEQIPVCLELINNVELTNYASDRISLEKELLNNLNTNVEDVVNKYASPSKKTKVMDIVGSSSFKNIIFSGRTQKFQRLFTSINDKIITLYASLPNKNKVELLKFEINNNLQRQYLKLYLENLTGATVEKINGLSGTILDKALQVGVPDYNKVDVIKMVINRWGILQDEVKKLKTKITDAEGEIDQLVYKLYGLGKDEVKIVEDSIVIN